jgi:hypothetical protein
MLTRPSVAPGAFIRQVGLRGERTVTAGIGSFARAFSPRWAVRPKGRMGVAAGAEPPDSDVTLGRLTP